jgi:hypothetical protein
MSATKSFLHQLERFAASRGFKMQRSVVSPDGQDFSIELKGEDFRIIAMNDARRYAMYFYVSTTKPVSEASVDDLVRDIKDDLGKVPGVTFPTPANRPYPTAPR